jgi:hypothetical protein
MQLATSMNKAKEPNITAEDQDMQEQQQINDCTEATGAYRTMDMQPSAVTKGNIYIYDGGLPQILVCKLWIMPVTLKCTKEKWTVTKEAKNLINEFQLKLSNNADKVL